MVIVFFQLSQSRREWYRYVVDIDKKQFPQRTVYIDGELLYDAIPAKSCLLSRLLPGHLKIFTEPMGTIDCIQSVSSPAGSKQISRCPITVIIAGSIPRDGFMHSFISLIQCYIPGTGFSCSLLFSLILPSHLIRRYVFRFR